MIRVLLVDDHEMFRQGLCRLLDSEDGIDVVGEADNGREAVECARELAPDVVVMDLTMPEMNGIDATVNLLRERPSAKVSILSMHAHARFVRESLGAGASGYLLKENAVSELIRAIRAVVEKEQVYLSPDVSHVVVDSFLKPSRSGGELAGIASLTEREREILQLVAEGFTSSQIADKLSVSVRTVENHRAGLTRKLRTRSLADLVKLAVREGLTPP